MKTDENDEVYRKTKRQKLLLMSQCGRSEESIKNQLRDVKNSKNVREYELVITAYLPAGDFENAYIWFEKSVKNTPTTVLFCFAAEMFVKSQGCTMRLLNIQPLYNTNHLT